MSEEQQAELDGQVEEGAEATQEDPVEQPADGTTPADTEDSFFDPKSVPDDLKPAYKQMQAAFTKRMQAISGDRQKIEAYDSFAKDPLGTMQQMAQKYGYQIVQSGQQQKSEPQGDWEPKSWEDVLTKAEERAYARIRQEFSPVISEVQQIKKTSIEQQLADIDPTWQQYEDKMTENLRAHPTLSKDPAMLYRLSVPQEVLESRATQRALKKLEARGQSSQVAGSSQTKKPGTAMPEKAVSFAEAVEIAKKKLAEQGMKAPR